MPSFSFSYYAIERGHYAAARLLLAEYYIAFFAAIAYFADAFFSFLLSCCRRHCFFALIFSPLPYFGFRQPPLFFMPPAEFRLRH